MKKSELRQLIKEELNIFSNNDNDDMDKNRLRRKVDLYKAIAAVKATGSDYVELGLMIDDIAYLAGFDMPEDRMEEFNAQEVAGNYDELRAALGLTKPSN